MEEWTVEANPETVDADIALLIPRHPFRNSRLIVKLLARHPNGPPHAGAPPGRYAPACPTTAHRLDTGTVLAVGQSWPEVEIIDRPESSGWTVE